MSGQVWQAVKAQELVPGNLIPNLMQPPVAVEVREVRVEGETVIVTFCSDLWRMAALTYHMKMDQPIPVAVSGIAYLEEVTNFEIVE